MRTRRIHRLLAVFLAKLMLLDILFPTAAFALTGGPAQPEFGSFEPISTDQMVDLFTGDFTYNIPLMTVPGPNGGYPINLAYHGGIGMEQEASWVGLGWNINAGAVNRVLRGLPDDFKGDEVTKTINLRPNNTYGISYSHGLDPFEVLGLDFQTANADFMLYINNYRGVGMRADVGLSTLTRDEIAGKKDVAPGLVGGLNMSFDSQNNGLAFRPSLSLHGTVGLLRSKTTASFALHSRYGLNELELKQEIGLGEPRVERKHNVDVQRVGALRQQAGFSRGTGLDFAATSFTPAPSHAVRGLNFKLGLVFGPCTAPTSTETFNMQGLFSTSYIPGSERTRSTAAYGYLYAEHQPELGNGLMDFTRDKDGPVTKRSPNAPMPVFTYDPYTISGQGTGGSFRPFRSDIGILSEEKVESESNGADATIEAMTGAVCWHVGVDAGYNHAASYAGPWRQGINAITGESPSLFGISVPGSVDLRFQDGDPLSDPLYEPFYFKAQGERTASATDQWAHVLHEQPVCFELGEIFDNGQGIFKANARVLNQISNASPYGIPNGMNKRPEREKRAQNIEYRTNAEIVGVDDYLALAPHHIYGASDFPWPGQGTEFDRSGVPGHHIGEIAVLGTDGTRHVYGLPVYNDEHHEVAFAIEDAEFIEGDGIDEYVDSPLAQMPGSPSSLEDNENGEDHFYSRTSIPKYSHAHLLTSVTSHDYVDLTGNGPSEDDLGYYTKFNYQEGGTELWRSPFRGVNYVKGYYSNTRDDKGTYSHGSKKTYYLHSIETKTHVARFILSDRQDGRGAYDEANGSGLGSTQKKLDRIELYSKALPDVPLKSVVFTYGDPEVEGSAYALCPGVPNNTEGGKLTLSKIHFEHMGSPKGSLSPYRFEYGDLMDADNNPAYSPLSADRWGNYRPMDNGAVTVNPYVDQSVEADLARDKHAAAWCLKKIKLPSGGEIQVDYESDDYAFVQDKAAMHLYRIVGTSDTGGNLTPSSTTAASINKNHRRIYVDMGRDYGGPVPLKAAIDAALLGVNDLYFKTWQRIKKKPFGGGGVAFDYVEGYCKVIAGSGLASGVDNRTACFDVQIMSYGTPNREVHPFRLAGWQYLRYERPDLQTPPNDVVNNSVVGTAVIAAINTIVSAIKLIGGYYNMAVVQGWNREIPLEGGSDPYQPSFVRLNTAVGLPVAEGPALRGKFGGGHRVRSVRILDNWSEGAHEYGKTYEYTTPLPNGTLISSGVAEYEPLLGGEEIPHRQPIWYNGSDARVSFRNKDAYLERPFGEALFPGANVGYSRVVVRDLQPGGGADLITAGNGTTVHEFYTAKDFPVRVENSTITSTHFAPPTIPIPLVGSIGLNSHGYSQGYAVHLNDMHGKLKAVSTYPQCADPTGEPRTRTFHRYNTLPDHPNRLSDEATVLTDHFTQQTAKLGTSTEFYVDVCEHSSESIGSGLAFNIQGTPFPVLMGLPSFEYSHSLFRSMVTTKVVHKLGILGEVVTEVDGARSSAESLVYDAYTGEPLLTVTNNAHDEPVYTYEYAAHMAYEGMSSAYKNWGASVSLAISGGTFPQPSANDPFLIGDELEYDGTSYWITALSGGNYELYDKNYDPPPNGTNTFKIRRSGRKNMQGVRNGSIVSLRDPIDLPLPDVLIQFNEQVPGGEFNNADPLSHQRTMDYRECDEDNATPSVVNLKLADPGALSTIVDIPLSWGGLAMVFDLPGVCKPYFLFPDNSLEFDGSDLLGNVYSMDDIRILGLVGEPFELPEGLPTLMGEVQPMLFEYNGGANTAIGFWWNPFDCFPICMPVLHADATEYKDQWTYDYVDVGDPLIAPATPISTAYVNPYAYGQANIWRPWKNHLYQVDRMNAESEVTHANTDGEYKRFTLFDFEDPVGSNFQERWVARDEITRYSPYGFALESKDANGVFSSELYGYNNTLVTATAINAPYHEIAAEGFENLNYYDTEPGSHLFFYQGTVGKGPGGHSGELSLSIDPNLGVPPTIRHEFGSTTDPWVPVPGKRYVVSAWFKVSPGQSPNIRVLDGSDPLDVDLLHHMDRSPTLDGWRKIEVEFVVPESYTELMIQFEIGGFSKLDDVRIHPAEATMNTFVYDFNRHWLKAQLDERNYATFYTYDEEGVLTQVKKETERGIVTLRTARQNVVNNP